MLRLAPRLAPSLAPALVALAGVLVPAHAGVIVVDAAGGGDATDLPQAVALAIEGDVLLVKPGSYSGFTIDGLSLRVVADGGVVTVTSSVAIRNLGAGQRVVLDEIDVQPAWIDIFSQPPALTIAGCAGSVHVERCNVLAPSAIANDLCEGFAAWPKGPDAVSVSNCADVAISTATLTGGAGIGSTNPLCLDSGSYGGRALAVVDSLVGLHDVVARGAIGMIDGYGGVGGNALDVSGASDVLASGVFAEGGDGGYSADFIGSTGFGGNGGHGANVEAPATLRVLGGSYAGGAPGGACCWTDFPGQPMVVTGNLIDYAGSHHRLLTSSPTREGGTLVVSISGQTGDLAWIALSTAPTFIHAAPLNGVLYLHPAFLTAPLPLATITSPQSQVPFQMPQMPPGVDVRLVDLQAIVFEPGTGALVLTAPAQLVVLDSSF